MVLLVLLLLLCSKSTCLVLCDNTHVCVGFTDDSGEYYLKTARCTVMRASLKEGSKDACDGSLTFRINNKVIRNLTNIGLLFMYIKTYITNFVFYNNTFLMFPELEHLTIESYFAFNMSSGTLNGLGKLTDLTILRIDKSQGPHYPTLYQKAPSFDTGWLHPALGIQQVWIDFDVMPGLPEMSFCGFPFLRDVLLDHNNINSSQGLGITCNSASNSCSPCLANKLISIRIDHNPIGTVSANFGREIPYLESLDLSACSLTSVYLDHITSKYRVRIKLSNNKLSALLTDKTELCYSPLLTKLEVQNNNLRHISPGLFTCTQHLKHLELANNSLQGDTLGIAGLNTLVVLKGLDLSYNNINTLHSGIVGNMVELEAFSCSGCNLKHIDGDTFLKLGKLRSLKLNRNKLNWIDKGTFLSPHKLHALDLSMNYLNDTSLLGKLPDVAELNLGDNQLTIIPEFQGSWKNLSTLILTGNKITEIDPSQLYGSLNVQRALRIYKHLKYIPDIKSENTQLTSIDLQSTSKFIMKLKSMRMNVKHLSHLDLSRNMIRNFKLGLFLFPRIKYVNLTYNKLESLNPDAFLSVSLPRPRVYLQGNSLHCDCNTEWLLNTNTGGKFGKGLSIPWPSRNDIGNELTGIKRHMAEVPDLDQVYCKNTLLDSNLVSAPITQTDLVCPYKTECYIRECRQGCCEQDVHCPCHSYCSSLCSCYHKHDQSINVMNCTARNLTHLPTQGPLYIKTLYLDENNIASLNSSYLNYVYLTELYVNNCHVVDVHDATFHDLHNLVLLDLNHNNIRQINAKLFQNLERLKRLYLQENSVKFIENGSFDELISLRILWLHSNNLEYLNISLLRRMENLTEISLHDNPWSCDCQYGPMFQKWLLEHIKIIVNIEQIHCKRGSSETLPGPLIHTDFIHCNRVATLNSIELRHTKSIYEAISLVVIVIMLSIFTLLAYKRRLLLKVWFYNRYGLSFHNEDTDNDARPYDVFMAYDKNDEVLVEEELDDERPLEDELLLAGLERRNYKVCIESRDWPGGAVITETVIAAVQQSKRTILLVSENHLNTQWCQYVFNAAHRQVLKDRQLRLIMILTDRELISRMNHTMRIYTKTKACLVIGEENFWERLCQCLADGPRGAVNEDDLDLLKVYDD